MRIILLIAAMLASPAWAQQVPRETDHVLTRDELGELLIGNMLEFYTGGFARYGLDGGYDYRYEVDGPPAPGTYDIQDDGMVCTVFQNGFNRCDLVVRSGERVVMIIENGERYPVKAVTALP